MIKHLDELQALHEALNGQLDLGFEFLPMAGNCRKRFYIHVLCPEWLAKCTMMGFRRAHTLCTKPLRREILHGYVVLENRTTYKEIPTEAELGERIIICEQCLGALRDVVLPQWEDELELEDAPALGRGV